MGFSFAPNGLDVNPPNGASAKHPVARITEAGSTSHIGEQREWRVKITTGSMCLLMIGSDAAAALIAINRHTPVVLIPFAIATLVSFGAVWWGHRYNGRLTSSPPFSGEKPRWIALTPIQQNRKTGTIKHGFAIHPIGKDQR